LLILDNHGSHISYAAVRYCRSHSIELLTLPPHTTHKWQPLDVCFFGPLKSKYSDYLVKWFSEHQRTNPKIEDIPAIFKFAFVDAAKPETAVNGFRKTGLWQHNLETGEWGPNKHTFDAEFIDEDSDAEDLPPGSPAGESPPDSPPESPPSSPAESPPDSPPESPPDSPPESPPNYSPQSPPTSPPQSPPTSPPRSPPTSPPRSPPNFPL
ncbi:unnamed protein product, partial [Allacma fusca]